MIAGSNESWFDVTTWRFPKSALAEVSLPLRNTPSQPSIALKYGKRAPVAANASPSVTVAPEEVIRYASPSTAAIVRSEKKSRTNTEPSRRMYRPGEARSTAAAAIGANAQAVPAAESQLTLKSAAYGAAASTAGGMRWTTLWSPGHSICV